MKKSKNKHLSQYFGLKNSDDLDFVDLDLTTDLHVYVDPLLLYRSPVYLFNEAHAMIVHFFQIAIDRVKSGNRNVARRMCRFPDAENLLGIAESGSGKGPNKRLGRKIFQELVANEEIQKRGLAHLSEFQLTIPGISFDLISDAAVQIAKDVFIKYTQEQCELHKIPMSRCQILYFDFEEKGWDHKFVQLPQNPFKNNKPFLLTPKSVVRRYPHGNHIEFYNEIYKDILVEMERERLWSSIGKEPKVSLTDIAKRYKKKSKIVEFIKENPQSKIDFFEKTKPLPETAWLEAYAVRHQENINQILGFQEIEVLEESFNKRKNLFKKAKEAASHQCELKRPAKNLVKEIEDLTKLTKKELVLVLGCFSDQQCLVRLKEIRKRLSDLKYTPVLINDFETPDESILESVLRIATMSRFIVIEDSYPSGHLYEIASLKGNGHIAAIMRLSGNQASFMSVGISQIEDGFGEFDYELIDGNGINPSHIDTAVDWVEEKIQKRNKFWAENYPWKRSS